MHSSVEVFRFRGVKMVGVLNRPEGPENKKFPAVLFLHGLPGSEKNVDIQRELLKRGIASFAPHFCGAWGSGGVYQISDLAAQARVALKFMRSQPFVDGKRVAVFGFSMGGWAALNLTSFEPALRTAVAVAPVGGPEVLNKDTRAAIAHLSRSLRIKSEPSFYRDFIRAIHENDPARSVARFGRPLLLIHGSADNVVFPAVSERLFAAAKGPKKLVRAKGAHHDFLDRRPWLTRVVADWFEQNLSR